MPSSARITAGELAVVLSHYDLGVIDSVTRFKGGSRQSPKIHLRSSTGEYLLKRRPPGVGSDERRVAFSHEVVLHLRSGGFPVPELIGTRADGRSMVKVGESIYELFRFVHGRRYARLRHEAHAAGWWMARCHQTLRTLKPTFPAPVRTYHAHPKIIERLSAIPGRLADPAARSVCRALSELYRTAAEKAQAAGAGTDDAEPVQIIHGDWHPGNMLFTAECASPDPETAAKASGPDCLRAVFDFDAARMGRPLHDAASAAMQFSVQRHLGEDPSAWRVSLDPDLLAAFWDGHGPVPAPQAAGVAWLMIEALIVEVVVPVALTGSFGKLPAGPMLGVVHRAGEAMAAQADRLAALAVQSTR